MTQFLSTVTTQQYQQAFEFSNQILEFEPNNELVKGYRSVLLEKLVQDREEAQLTTENGVGDADEGDETEETETFQREDKESSESEPESESEEDEDVDSKSADNNTLVL